MTVRTRFAPSPTAFCISETANRAFLLVVCAPAWREFILRIEDTDLERSTNAAIQQILDGMEWPP